MTAISHAGLSFPFLSKTRAITAGHCSRGTLCNSSMNDCIRGGLTGCACCQRDVLLRSPSPESDGFPVEHAPSGLRSSTSAGSSGSSAAGPGVSGGGIGQVRMSERRFSRMARSSSSPILYPMLIGSRVVCDSKYLMRVPILLSSRYLWSRSTFSTGPSMDKQDIMCICV